MQTINVDLGERSYPIYIGSSLYNELGLYVEHVRGNQIAIVTNETIAPLYLESLNATLTDSGKFKVVDSIILPDGEEYKSLSTLDNIFSELLKQKHNRTTTVVALGGGVIGDMAGFAAACYQRGVDFIQVPTTLLSMVDSSVGGKTAVNHPLGKNMIGAFYQPRAVIADLLVLETLEQRELSAGLAEVIKYGIIYDQNFFDWLEKNIGKLIALDPEALIFAIKRSCQIKAEIVAQDEKEHGSRALLNLGHTFGHAIETALGYGVMLHGEAVAVGTHIAALTSESLGLITKEMVKRIKDLLVAAQLPIYVPGNISNERFFELMAVDKKVLDGTLRLILPTSIGTSKIADNVDRLLIDRAIDAAR
jgi:3-dehydroquinate synthase